METSSSPQALRADFRATMKKLADLHQKAQYHISSDERAEAFTSFYYLAEEAQTMLDELINSVQDFPAPR